MLSCLAQSCGIPSLSDTLHMLIPCVTEKRLSGGCLHPGGCQEQSSFCLRWRWCMELPCWAPICTQCCPQMQMCTSPLPGPRARSCRMWQTLTAGERLVQLDQASRQSPAHEAYSATDWSQAQCVRCLLHLAVLMQAWPLLVSTRCNGQNIMVCACPAQANVCKCTAGAHGSREGA